MSSKPFSEMTLDELRAEHEHWDKKIREATGWGAAVGAADEFRRDCAREIRRRGGETEHLGTVAL